MVCLCMKAYGSAPGGDILGLTSVGTENSEAVKLERVFGPSCATVSCLISGCIKRALDEFE